MGFILEIILKTIMIGVVIIIIYHVTSSSNRKIRKNRRQYYISYLVGDVNKKIWVNSEVIILHNDIKDIKDIKKIEEGLKEELEKEVVILFFTKIK